MYVKFDYKCMNCGDVEERFIRRKDMEKQYCYDCDSDEYMVKLPAATATTFKFADPSATKRRR